MVTALLLLATAPATLAESPLQPWSALIGHCWVGSPPGGIQATDKHCFESVYGGQHVRDRHVVTMGGRDVYAGETLYSVKGTQVIFTYWNSLGGLGTGNASWAGGEWRFTGTILGTPTGAEEPVRASWKITSEGYQVSDGTGPPRLFKRAD